MNVQAQALFSGLSIGTVYALLALGLVVTYRTTKVLNLAHGESMILAALVAYGLQSTALPLAITLALAVASGVLFAVLIETLLLRQRAHLPPPMLILITLGVAFLARGFFLALFGTNARSFDRILDGPAVRLAGAVVSRQSLLLIGVGVIVGVGVTILLGRSASGRAFVASAENPDAARLLGVNVPRVRLQAFALGGALAGLAAVLVVPLSAVDYQSGLGFTLRGFIAAAVGGLLSPGIAVAAGLGLGVAESLLGSYIGTLYRTPVVFAVLIAVAVFQSRGIQFAGASRA